MNVPQGHNKPPAFPGSPDYFRQRAASLADKVHRTQDDGRTHLHPLVRVALIVLAIAGTVTYGMHVTERFAADPRDLSWVGPGVAWGAGISWAVLAISAAVLVRDARRLGELADHALVTLTLGMVGVLSALAITKATSAPPVATHVVLLGLSNVAMGAYFILRGPAVGLKRPIAAALWIGLMNGVLAVGLIASYLLHAPA
ncbi:MAG: hypothetical protein AAF916_04475 [Planctomycetota bacterium]